MSAERFHSTSTIALMTPVSALVYEGKWSINSANGARCEHTGALTRSARPMNQFAFFLNHFRWQRCRNGKKWTTLSVLPIITKEHSRFRY
jgi:hypothetical protein